MVYFSTEMVHACAAQKCDSVSLNYGGPFFNV